MVLASTTLSMMPGAAVAPRSINRTFEAAPGTPLGDQLAAVLQFVLALTLFVAFHTDCASAGWVDEKSAATIASNKGSKWSKCFFMRFMISVVSAVNLM